MVSENLEVLVDSFPGRSDFVLVKNFENSFVEFEFEGEGILNCF